MHRISDPHKSDLYDGSVLVDFPDTAKFLTLEERAFLIWRKSKLNSRFWEIGYDICISSGYDNSSVGEEEKFAVKYIWAAFADWQVSC